VDPRGATCLVTGASSGIGRAAALALAEKGARLALSGRDTTRLAEVATATGGHAIAADLTEPGAPERLAAAAHDRLGAVDVLVNNAGVGLAGSFADVPPERVDELVAVNLCAPVLLARALLPGMLERRRGAIVNVASIAGHLGVAGEAVYAATKAGLIGFGESLRQELAGTGVQVSLISPGVVDTMFFERRGAPYARRRPRPVPAERAAAAIVAAIETGAPRLYVARWFVLPVRLHATLPGVYRTLAARFG
jgi:short-subunit dehydrogenase